MKMARNLAVLAAAALAGGCLPHPPPPAAPYHAVGIDRPWHVIIDDKYVTYIAGPGQTPLLQTVPKPITGVAGETWHTQRIHVNVVHAQCVAGGRTYPHRVQVTVDGNPLTGCGGL